MASMLKEDVAGAPSQDVMLTSPFKIPVTEMGSFSRAAYRFRWFFGHRLIGENSWAWKVKKRFAYQRWVLFHVHGWYGLALWRAGIRRPFSVTVEGRRFEVKDDGQKREFSRQLRRIYNPVRLEDVVLDDGTPAFRISFGGREVRFGQHRDRFGSSIVLTECFVYEYFSGLDVKGKVVIDVGSSVGDTPIYFALRGATKVIAFEPYPATHSKAKYNITLNGLDEKITLLNEGGGTTGVMKLSRSDTNLWANAMPSPDGEPVRFSSLKDMIQRFGIEDGILKYHGEGSEYEFFEQATTEELRRFSQIAMKYHYGGKRIIQKLQKSGFSIARTWDLHFSYNASSSSPRYEAGLVLANRIGPPTDTERGSSA